MLKTLYLAWQAPDTTRAWFPIGRLDADADQQDFRFRYTGGALEAEKRAGLKPLMSFPDFRTDYHAHELFPLFQNRALSPSRKDFPDYVSWLGLEPAHAGPMEIQAVRGGVRATDSMEVFPRVQKDADGGFM